MYNQFSKEIQLIFNERIANALVMCNDTYCHK